MVLGGLLTSNFSLLTSYRYPNIFCLCWFPRAVQVGYGYANREFLSRFCRYIEGYIYGFCFRIAPVFIRYLYSFLLFRYAQQCADAF